MARQKRVFGKSGRFGKKGRYRMATIGAIAVGLAALAVATGMFVWTFCRIEPANDQFAILISKMGKPLRPDQIIATEPDQQGIQLKPLTEGRHFRNPLKWDWVYSTATIIPNGKVGVVTRLYGKDLPPGAIIAPEGYKGIAEQVLTPNKYHINPFAEYVDIFDAIKISPEGVGVVIHLDGADPIHGTIPDDMKNVYTVSETVKGVQNRILEPGTYYLNPYKYNVIEVNVQNQRFELQSEDAITFLTQDGFQITVEGTLVFAISRDKAALLTHQVGDMDDILKKIILPKARGFSRIEGSKHPAISFIVGETRQEFQNSLEKHLIAQCARWGVEIRSMLIRNITPPEEVSAIIRERELALQNQKKIDQQIEQARSQAELTRQEMLAEQNREKVESETAAIRARIQAEQVRSVRMTESTQKLEVARIEAEAAKLQAEATLIRAEAERSVVALRNEAEASVTGAMVTAFGGGQNLARYSLYKKTAPMIGAVISTDREPGLGGIFQSFMPESGRAPVAGGAE